MADTAIVTSVYDMDVSNEKIVVERPDAPAAMRQDLALAQKGGARRRAGLGSTQ